MANIMLKYGHRKMSEIKKLTVKFTVTMSEEDKKNSDIDIPKLDSLLREQTGAKITAALFHRLCLQNLHRILEEGRLIIWPPRLGIQKSKLKRPPRQKRKLSS